MGSSCPLAYRIFRHSHRRAVSHSFSPKSVVAAAYPPAYTADPNGAGTGPELLPAQRKEVSEVLLFRRQLVGRACTLGVEFMTKFAATDYLLPAIAVGILSSRGLCHILLEGAPPYCPQPKPLQKPGDFFFRWVAPLRPGGWHSRWEEPHTFYSDCIDQPRMGIWEEPPWGAQIGLGILLGVPGFDRFDFTRDPRQFVPEGHPPVYFTGHPWAEPSRRGGGGSQIITRPFVPVVP